MIHLLTGFFTICLLATALSGVDRQRSLLGAYPYFQGAVTFIFLFFLTLIVYYLNLSHKIVARTVIISAVIVSTISLYQYIQLINGIPISTYAGRVISTFGQPNFYAGFLILILPFWLYLWRQKKQIEQIVLLAGLTVIIAGIAVSFSKTAIFLTGLFFSIWIVNKYIKQSKVKLVIAVITIVAFFSGLHITGIIQKEIIDPIQKQTVSDGNVEKRIYIWQVSLEVINKSPIIGYGLENIYLAFPKDFDFNHPKPAFYRSIRDLNIDRAHNLFLDLLLFSGIIGLISWILLFSVALIKANQTFIKIGIFLFLFWSTVQNLSLIHWFIFFLYLGLIRTRHIDSRKLNKVL